MGDLDQALHLLLSLVFQAQCRAVVAAAVVVVVFMALISRK